MEPEEQRGPLRLGAAALMALLGLALVRVALLPLVRSSWPVSSAAVPRVDDIVLGILAWVCLVVTLWLGLSALLTCLARLPGAVGRGAARCVAALTPALVRRGLSLVVGTGLGTVGLPVGPATASSVVTSAAPDGRPGGSHGGSAPDRAPTSTTPDPAFSPSAVPAGTAPGGGRPASAGLGAPSPHFTVTAPAPGAGAPAPDARWLPTPPPRSADLRDTALLAPTPRAAFIPEDVVTVRQGDSLWSLAARQLGRGASDRDIARAWPRWYALNADVIGADPDLIHPGQQLRIPSTGEQR